MAFTDLQQFLAALERDGDLARVTAPVDPHLEVTGIVQRVIAEKGPALLFENPSRGQMPLAVNLFGTERRMARALGVESLDEIGDRIGDLLKPELPHGFSGLKDALGKVGQLRAAPPKTVKSAPVQEVVLTGDDVDLSILPGVFAWPEDGGVFLNLGLTHTKHPETGARNLGMYRLQLQDKRTVSLHWQIHKDSSSHAAIAERRGERLPVAIAFGCPPAVTYSASAPLPADIDEYLFAGFVQRERVEMVACKSVPLEVPAHAQVVLEGWVEPGERLPEGPFGDHTGFYTPVEPFPFLRVQTLTMRRNPIYQTIIVGRPPQEDGPLGKATERIFLPLLRLTIPEIVDYDLPAAGVFHNCAIVSIQKRFPKHAHKVMHAIWGAGLMSLTKLIVIVDAECNVHDYNEVAWRAFGNVDYSRDILQTVGPVDHLDHSAYEQFYGGKLGIDATGKLPTEGYHRAGGWPQECVLDPTTTATVDRRWTEYGIPAPSPVRKSPVSLCEAEVVNQARVMPGGPDGRLACVVTSSELGPADQLADPPPGSVRLFLRLVMIEHSVFALPFAYIAALTAMWTQTRSVHWVQLLLITVAMVSARTVAMGANRILDRRFDALNPRTARRELVTGAITVRSASTGTLAALVVFLASALALRPICLLLAPVAVILLVLYSYGKRFTDFPQVLLALAQFVAPVGAWIAVTGGPSWAAFWLGVAVGTWIGGFDLIYSCQDAVVDREIGSRSYPARFGIPAALRASSLVHVATVFAYAGFGWAAGLGWLWWVGLGLTAAVLVYEHVIVRAKDLSRVNRAFFTANGVIGLCLFAFALADLIAQGLHY